MSRQPPGPIRQPGQGLRNPQQHQLQLGQRQQQQRDEEKKRDSGAGGIGFGMLNGDMSDDDDDDERVRQQPQRPPPAAARQNSGPNSRSSPPQRNAPARGPPPPGLNPPAPVQSPPPPGPVSRPTQTLQPQPAQPRAAFMPPLLRSTSTEPHRIQQSPSTPIVAKFQLHEENGKNRMTVFGDEFWQRFNKMAADDDKKKKQNKGESSFMREHLRGAGRLSKWVWCCSIVIILLIAGGSAAGWYFTRNQPGAQPAVLNGSANENSITDIYSDEPTTASRSGSSTRGAATQPSPTATRSGTGNARRHHLRRLEPDLLD